MKIVLVSALLVVGLAGCATPVTQLQDPKTGAIVQCGGGKGGSIAGGLIGHAIEKSQDEECVKRYQGSGYVVVTPKT